MELLLDDRGIPDTPTCLRAIPVSINNILGDPFIPRQLQDTFSKLDSLQASRHRGPISIITKFAINTPMLRRLSQYRTMSSLVIFYTLTGFDEGGTGFTERQKVYRQIASVIPNTVLLYRPIVQNENDSRNVMETMLGLCRETNTCLVFTGLYTDCEGANRKRLATETEELLLHLAKKAEVSVFPKSACATSYLLKTQCFAHVDNAPKHLDVIAGFYGDRFDQRLFLLRQGTPGDRNFVRFITGRSPSIRGPGRDHFLSIQAENPLLCSSSWFSWSQIVPCDIGCWYCSTEYVFPECKKAERIGCNPATLADGVYEDKERSR